MSNRDLARFIDWCREAATRLRETPFIPPSDLTDIQRSLFHTGTRLLPVALIESLPPPPLGSYVDFVHLKENFDRSLGLPSKRHTSVLTALERVIAWYEGATPKSDNEDQPHRDHIFELLKVFTGGIVDDRLRQAAGVLADTSLTVDAKLTAIDRLISFPPTVSAQQLAELLRVSKTAIVRSGWWGRHRRGSRNETVQRRRDRLEELGRQYEPRNEDGEEW